jgi:hypothetical protein
VLTGCFNEPPTANEQVRPAYILPAEITIDFSAHRNSGAGITLTGSSNLPEGTRLDAELLAPNGHIQGQTSMNVRADGAFYSEEFTNDGKPWPSGKHKVHVYAYFNGAWQTNSILQITGKGGIKLKGKVIKKQDSDVIDSDNTIDLVKMVDFPSLAAEPAAPKVPLSNKGDAIEHVEGGVVPFAISSCCRNAPLDIRAANELPQRAKSSLEARP